MNRSYFKAGEAVDFVSDLSFKSLSCNSKGRVSNGSWWQPGNYVSTAYDFGRSYHCVLDENGKTHFIPARRLRSRKK